MPQSADRRAITRAYEEGKADGVRVWVYQLDGLNKVYVDPARNFKEGDRLEVVLESNFEGYVYIINVAPSGQTTLLFPEKDEVGKHKLRARGRYVMPRLKMDGEKGFEVLRVVLAEKKIARYEEAAAQGGDLGKTAPPAAGSPSGVVVDGGASGPASRDGFTSRDIDLAPVEKDPAEGTTLVARPEPAGPQGTSSLNKGVFTFEIRLRKD